MTASPISFAVVQYMGFKIEMIFLIAGPRLRGTLVILAWIILVSELGLSVIVASRNAIPNSTSLIFPITLPLARWGPPGHACVLHLDT